ncbi:MAG TPA: CvpA family protein [Candidatus Binatia bacterium]
MNWIDLILVMVLALFGFRGYFRGLFREVFSVVGLVAGFTLAVRYDDRIATLFHEHWDLPPFLIKGAAFIAIFFAIYFVCSLIGWLLHRSERAVFLRTVNRFGGVAVGLTKGVAITALAVSFIGSASWLPRATRDKFEHASLISPLSDLAVSLIRLSREKLLPKVPDQA